MNYSKYVFIGNIQNNQLVNQIIRKMLTVKISIFFLLSYVSLKRKKHF